MGSDESKMVKKVQNGQKVAKMSQKLSKVVKMVIKMAKMGPKMLINGQNGSEIA